ncbi:MAG: hypothetical protein ACLQLC_06930 [Candidatus Sulfotelmatobacter sp.]
MSGIEKPKRIRRRSLRLQLEQCLRDAEVAATADISTQKLIQTRLTTLTRLLNRERNDRLKEALEELAMLRAENERLARQHEQHSAEVARLRAVCRTETGLSFDEIAKMRGRDGRS